MSFTAGSKLGVYEIVEPIGEGGMGEVYRARDTVLDRDVAIKVLRQELASDSNRLRRFEQEARSASALNHPNIIHIYTIGEHEGTRYIAMEYVSGRTLRELLRDTPLPTPKVLEIATQIASGLAKAHSAGIVHRDLKPENLMVTEEGYVKILDFGLAKLLPEPVQAGSEMVTRDKLETRQGVVVGTVQYMSPEQAMGRRVDARTDQFSLGSILYEMATGKLAFPRDSLPQTMAAIIEDEAKPIRKLNSQVPAELATIIERCLRKDPSKRYESTGDLVRELKNVPGETSPAQRARRGFLYGAAALLAVGLVLGLGMNLGRLRDLVLPGETRASIESLAILPLHNLSGDPDQEYFADGMTEALITDLAKIGALKVISRTSAMRYKGSDKPLSAIASELNVDAVVEGSALRVGDRVRITAQLIDVETQQALWAETYERDFQDLLVLQSEVARAVAHEIEVTVTPEATARPVSIRGVNPEAHEAYLQGRFHYYKLTPQDFETALSYFNLALEKDPNYAPAHAGIARVWIGRQQLGHAPAREATPLARASILKALELDESLGEAHSALAVLERNDWDWASAEREYERSIELNPNDADARADYSHLLTIMGRPDEALAQIKRALELDPFNAYFLAFYGVDLMCARRYDDAIAQFRKALETSPHFPLAGRLSDTLHLQGNYEEALAAERANRAARDDREAEEALTRGFEEAGYAGAMRRLADTFAARSSKNHTGAMRVTRFYLRAGENELALEWLERAFRDRDPNVPYIGVVPALDPLRDDPRFKVLLSRLNLPL